MRPIGSAPSWSRSTTTTSLGPSDVRRQPESLRCDLGQGLDIPAWLQIVPQGQLVVCSRLMVDRAVRSGGKFSLALMRAIYDHGRQQGVRVCLCCTRAPLIGFFERFGFRRYGHPFFDDTSGQLQFPLALFLEDVAHLSAVASPFLAEARARKHRPPEVAWLEILMPAQHESPSPIIGRGVTGEQV